MSATLTPKLTVDMGRFQAMLTRYQLETGKTVDDALRKQAQNLSAFLSERLSRLAPSKGSIRDEAHARFDEGGGIKISPAARTGRSGVFTSIKSRIAKGGKFYKPKRTFGGEVLTEIIPISQGGKVRMVGVKTATKRIAAGAKKLGTGSLLAKREIAIRESASKFLGLSVPFLPWGKDAGASKLKTGTGGRVVASLANIRKLITWTWGKSISTVSGKAAVGMEKARQQSIAHLALRDTIADMRRYLDNRLAKQSAKGVK
jgi:hypothetical protein